MNNLSTPATAAYHFSIRSGNQIRASLPIVLLMLTLSSISARAETATVMNPVSEATVEEIQEFFKSQGKRVLTFVGYSGAGYEDPAAMLGIASRILDQFEPAATIVNIGATPEGIGAVYEIASQRGFYTTGIVSTQARAYEADLSRFADVVFYVADASWGGFLEGTQKLSPTSRAMVAASDVMIGIGGGEVGRDELLAAKKAGVDVRFYPADMNHEMARNKAVKKGLPEPMDFRGAAGEVLKATTGE